MEDRIKALELEIESLKLKIKTLEAKEQVRIYDTGQVVFHPNWTVC